MKVGVFAMCMLVVVVSAYAQTRPTTTATEKSVTGSWKSEDLGLDSPIWMVDTYATDGTVQTDFYSKRPGKPLHHSDEVLHKRWRIASDALEIGATDDAGTFKREGQPRAVKTDANGRVVSITGWTRFDPASTRPASQPSTTPNPR